MAGDITILQPSSGAASGMGGHVSPTFIANGRFSETNLLKTSVVTVKLYFSKNDVLIGGVRDADVSECKWSYTATLPTGTDYKLEAKLYFDGVLQDSEISQYWKVSANGASYPDNLPCDVTPLTPTHPDVLLDAKPSVLATSGGCGCPLKPVPADFCWDFAHSWNSEITSAVCLLYNHATGAFVKMTPATLALGRCAARILLPKGTVRVGYEAKFILSDADGTVLLVSPPRRFPPI